MGNTFAIALTLIVLCMDISLIIATYVLKRVRKARAAKLELHKSKLELQLVDGEIDEDQIDPEELFALFKELKGSLSLPAQREEYLLQLLLGTNIPHIHMERLQSRRRLRRIEAAANLRYLYHASVRDALVKALKEEQDTSVALYIAQALAIQKDTRAIIPLIRHIRRATPWMASRLRAVLFSFDESLLPYLLKRMDNSRSYMQKIICKYAYLHPYEEFRTYLTNLANSNRPVIRYLALQALVKHFPEELIGEPFISSQKKDILRSVIQAYGNLQDEKNIPRILSFANANSLQ